MNRITITGRLTRDPELRSLPSGDPVCKLRLAVDGMAPKRETGYVDVSAFGPSGEAAARVLTKGYLVAVDGRLRVLAPGRRTARPATPTRWSGTSSSSPPRRATGAATATATASADSDNDAEPARSPQEEIASVQRPAGRPTRASRQAP